MKGKSTVLLLMAEILHQLRLVVYPIIYRVSLWFSSWWFFTNPSEKYAQVKLGSSSSIFGVKIPKIFELPPPSSTIIR